MSQIAWSLPLPVTRYGPPFTLVPSLEPLCRDYGEVRARRSGLHGEWMTSLLGWGKSERKLAKRRSLDEDKEGGNVYDYSYRSLPQQSNGGVYTPRDCSPRRAGLSY